MLPAPKKHTRRSQGSPLWEGQDDIQKATARSKQEPRRSSLTLKQPTPAKSGPAGQRHEDSNVPPTFSQAIASIETAPEALAESQRSFEFSPSDLQNGETSRLNSETSPWLRELPDAGTILLQRNGYIPPLTNEILAAIHVVLGRDAAQSMSAISAYTPDFEKTLKEDRNVLLEETKYEDPEWAHLDNYQMDREVDEASIANFLDRLWLADLRFCKNQQEAIFQRTVMMDMINRHHLVFPNSKMLSKLQESSLMFSVEATWDCPPMPTARFKKALPDSRIYTTMPKPDLCVSFRASKIIGEDLWNKLPPTTQHLICYEGITSNKCDRAFGFFFVEAKQSRAEPDDRIALNQALNNASTALHNIHEFFKEAEDTATFFKHVRVFSATASERGAILRVHRAVELPPDTDLSLKRVFEDYPLQFEYQTYKSFRGESFSRLEVVDAFERIIRGYGEKRLLVLLQKAALNLRKKAHDAWRNTHIVPFGTAYNDYYYGQVGTSGSKRSSRRQTSAPEGSHSRPRSSIALMPPPPSDLPRSIRESFRSDATAEVGDSQTLGDGSNLGQGIAGVGVASFESQRSIGSGSQRQGRTISPAKRQGGPSKKRKTRGKG